MRILFFLESLHAGGKERRAVELFFYLKKNTDFDFEIILTEDKIHYEYLSDLKIPIHFVKRRFTKKDPFLFYQFYNIAKTFRPDIIHAWGMMTTFYAIPTSKILKVKLLNSAIANAFPKSKRSVFLNTIWRINHRFSDLIIANSKAGIKAYEANPEKSMVIYNGVRIERFSGMKDKNMVRKAYGIYTPYLLIMVANFGEYKNHQLLMDVAKQLMRLRSDVTFIAVGEGKGKTAIMNRVDQEKIEPFLFTGRVSKVEELVNASDIGLLFSHPATGEGISNSIIEYMALAKPVIATDAGGTNELVQDGVSGFLVDENTAEIVKKINSLLDDSKKRKEMGEKGREIVHKKFELERMGRQFANLYHSLLKESDFNFGIKN